MEATGRAQPKIVLNNEDDALQLFSKALLQSGKLSSDKFRCKRCPVIYNAFGVKANKIKKVEVEYTIHEGEYEVQHNGEKFTLVYEKGDCKITTECRRIQFIKELTVYGSTVKKIQEFVGYVFDFLNSESDDSQITIYENSNGNWRVSKVKKPRTLESVIFPENFVSKIMRDINEFIESESWYGQMGIPYKRSFLFYGPPGTGKSSFAQAIAGHIKFSICFVNCSDKINDFSFNNLLNLAPKQSVILIEDVDAIFTERKNLDKNNALTFSGFLNAIDGVRSQEGRIVIMTTNYKERLDPALLRPGRVDMSLEIGLATKHQIQQMCLRFFKDDKLAKDFAEKVPEGKFSMSMIQGFLVNHRKSYENILMDIDELLQSDQNVKIDQFLTEIGCLEVLNDFKIEQCYTLAAAKNLPKSELEKITTKLSPLLKGRMFEMIRAERKSYLKSFEAIDRFIEEYIKDEEAQRKLRQFVKETNVTTFFQVKDKHEEMQKQP